MGNSLHKSRMVRGHSCTAARCVIFVGNLPNLFCHHRHNLTSAVKDCRIHGIQKCWDPLLVVWFPSIRRKIHFGVISLRGCNCVKWRLIGIPARELTYPTFGKGKSSSRVPWEKDILIPRRLPIFPGQTIIIGFLVDTVACWEVDHPLEKVVKLWSSGDQPKNRRVCKRAGNVSWPCFFWCICVCTPLKKPRKQRW